MARVVIPTKNRPESLLNVLNYLKIFHPGTESIVVDGSNAVCQAANRANIEPLRSALAIDYRPYPEELPSFDQLIDALQREPDEFFIMGSDAGFPMLDVLTPGEQFLRENPECSAVVGGLVSLSWQADNRVTARLEPARQIFWNKVDQRMKMYSLWPFPTTYGITRRDVLIARFERGRKLFLPGFFDYMAGLQDAMMGTIKALPSIGFIATGHRNDGGPGGEQGLGFLRNAASVLEFKETLKQDLIRNAQLDADSAEAVSVNLIKRQLSELLGFPAHEKPGFSATRLFQNRLVQVQCRIFEHLFRAGMQVRKTYESKLKYIAGTLTQEPKLPDESDNLGKNEIELEFDVDRATMLK